MGSYCAYGDVNLMTNITSSDVANADVTSLIAEATSIVNGDLNTRIVRERISPIDNTRKNEINGSNTTYYVKKWEKYIGDDDDDGDVDTSDITVYQVASDGTETTLTVSTITPNDGKFVLSSAPSGVDLYVTYNWTLVSVSDPHALVKQACVFLTAAFCYEKINRGMSPQQVYGNVRFMRDMQAGNEYYKRYQDVISKINSEMGDFAEAEDM